jgi:hypothetical protein
MANRRQLQQLPNGNTLITYSNSGQIPEVNSAWSTVQTLKRSFGYADWRETLYGPPTRKYCCPISSGHRWSGDLASALRVHYSRASTSSACRLAMFAPEASNVGKLSRA